jgi:hypothetical protein
MAAQPTVIKRGETKCKLCGHVFPSNPLHAATLVGANPQAKMAQIQALLAPMMKHLQKKHPAELQWSQLLGGECAGMMALRFFENHEPTTEQQQDFTRWKIHTLTKRAVVTNERIIERLATTVRKTFAKTSAELPPELIEDQVETFMNGPLAHAIVETMQHMRDVLQEEGRYDMQGKPPVTAAEHEEAPITA